MEVNIKQQFEKPLLRREEYILGVKQAITPSYAELKAEIAKKLNKPESLIVIKKVDQQFGSQGAAVHIYLYENEEAMKKFEKGKEEKKEGKEKEEGKGK